VLTRAVAVSGGQYWSWRGTSSRVGTLGATTAGESGDGHDRGDACVVGRQRDESAEGVAGDEQRQIRPGDGVESGDDVEALADPIGMHSSEVEADRREPGARQRGEERVDDDVEAVAAVQRMRVADHDRPDRRPFGLGDVGGERLAIGRVQRQRPHELILAEPRRTRRVVVAVVSARHGRSGADET
jgi:hypothetical protein